MSFRAASLLLIAFVVAPGTFAAGADNVIPRFSMDDALSVPFVDALVPSPDRKALVWTVHVRGAKDVAQARTIGRAVINSNLVRTALYGEDPNWGRIIAAAGSVNAGLDPATWWLQLNGKTWVQPGAIEALSEAEAHSELELTDIVVDLHFGIPRNPRDGDVADFHTGIKAM